jgi:hypothetical protein
VRREAPAHITIAGKPVAWVEKFKYLGSQFSSDGGLDAELSYRCQRAADAFQRLHKAVWRHTCVQLATKMRDYRCMVASVLLYGAHCWALSAAQLERLEVLQRSHLRRILGRSSWKVPPGGASQPKLLSNEQLLAACEGQPSIESQLLRQRGRWVGHVLRMPGHRLAKKFFFGDLISSAPPQASYSYPTLSRVYCADVASRYPRHELRKLDTPCLLLAAQDKTDWKNHFP